MSQKNVIFIYTAVRTPNRTATTSTSMLRHGSRLSDLNGFFGTICNTEHLREIWILEGLMCLFSRFIGSSSKNIVKVHIGFNRSAGCDMGEG
jgi:hypothetical protein